MRYSLQSMSTAMAGSIKSPARRGSRKPGNARRAGPWRRSETGAIPSHDNRFARKVTDGIKHADIGDGSL